MGKASPKKPSQWTSVFLAHMFSQRRETEKNLRAQERCQRPSPAHPLRGLIIRPRNHNVTTLCGACLPGTMEFCPTVVGRHFSSGTWLCFIESTQHWLLGTWLGGVLSGLGNNKCSSGTLRQSYRGGRPAGHSLRGEEDQGSVLTPTRRSLEPRALEPLVGVLPFVASGRGETAAGGSALCLRR